MTTKPSSNPSVSWEDVIQTLNGVALVDSSMELIYLKKEECLISRGSKGT